MSLNLCAIATEDWIDAHAVRWVRYVRKYNPDAKLYLYYIGSDMAGKFPKMYDEFEKVIERPLEGRPQFNRIRMSATTDFGVDEILYCDLDADIIAPLDNIADGLHPKATLACVESPAVHKDWANMADDKGMDRREFNNGLLLMRDDWGGRYDKAVEAVQGKANPRIIGTIAFNYMLNTNQNWGELDPKYGVIWWDVRSFLGAKIVQYCNDEGQMKRVVMENEWRASRTQRGMVWQV